MNSNDGVWIGGSVEATNSAIAGRDATLSVGNTGTGPATPVTLEELRAGLTALLDRIHAAADFPEQDEVVETIEQARTEAAKPRPNRHLLAAFLDVTGKAVAGLTPLATLVTGLRSAIDVIFAD
ncbi:hypothetical protein ACFVUS_03030 [Nocardia sp. NPDC058058]|uniref:hypothetical protein n=1 Tax=Nocardia sp. NPDC058058 TaxID=3346317 RepID=UPI0036DDE835